MVANTAACQNDSHVKMATPTNIPARIVKGRPIPNRHIGRPPSRQNKRRLMREASENNSFALRLNIIAFLLFTITFTTIGCFNIGPHAVQHEWLKYNNVISNIEDQQNLLNLVKLRYNDSPKMLAVTNINSQLLLGVADDSGMSYSFAEGATSLGNRFNFSLFPKYEDKPTITYQPLQGEKFVKSMLEQISLMSFSS